MDLGTLFIVLSIFLILFMLGGQLLARKNRLPALQTSPLYVKKSDRQAYVETLKEIRRLEVDFQSGNLSTMEYSLIQKDLETRGNQLLEKIDTGHGRAPSADLQTNEQIEELIEKRRMSRLEKSAGFCPQCGKPVQKSDRFCPFCGRQTS